MNTEPNRNQARSPRPRRSSGKCILPALLLAAGLLAAAGCSQPFIKMPRSESEKTSAVRPAACGAYMHGIFAEQSGDWKKAKEYYASAHEIDPDSMRIVTRLAVSTYESGSIEEAKPLLREAQTAANDDPELALVLARFFARQRQQPEALRYYDIAAQREDLRFQALFEEARLLENAGKKEEAEEKYVALAQKVDDPMSKVILGEFYMRSDRYGDALKQFTPVAKSQPYILGYIAVCQAETGNLDGAMASLMTYVENNCPAGPAFTTQQGGESVTVHEAADSVNGSSPWSPFMRVASVALAKGKPDKAVQVLQAATGCGGDTLPLCEMLGDAQKAAGNKAQARDAWTKALGLAEQEGDKTRLQNKISQLDR